MCLRADDKTIYIADKDIVCYKLGKISKLGKLFSPITRTTYGYTRNVPTEPVELYFGGYYEDQVNEGYHSATSLKSLSDTRSAYGTYELRDRKAGVFIIPKGSKYIKGFFNNSIYPNYVSESLIYIGPNNLITKFRLLWRQFKQKSN